MYENAYFNKKGVTPLDNAFTNAGKKLLAAWKNTKTSQKVLIILVVALTIVALAVVGTMAGQVEYASLYSGLTAAEAGQVQAQLKEDGVDFVVGTDGSIMVPAADAARIRNELSNSGIPASGPNYDFYSSKAGSFGATDKDKELYAKFQLEQNISGMINQMDKIKSSTVILTLGESSKFVLSKDGNTQSTASVMLVVKDGQTLSESDVNAIRAIVTTAVPSLQEDNITIADSNMNSYGTNGSSGGTSLVDTQLALQKKVGTDLEQQMIKLLAPVFGQEKLSASVSVTLDFDKETTNTLTLSPPVNDAGNIGIVTSMKQTVERLQNGATVPQGAVGQDPNGGAPTYQEIDAAAQDSPYYNAVTEVNAEVNEINQTLEKAQGQIKELSATLIIDNTDQDMTAILPEVRQQIATAIGVPENKITVSSMPFAQNTLYEQAMAEQEAAIQQAQQMELIKSLVTPIAIAAAILIAVMLLLSSRKKRLAMTLAAQQEEQWAAQETEQQHIDVVADEEIDMEELLKEKEDNTLGQIQTLADKDPDAIVQLLRNWLSDDIRG